MDADDTRRRREDNLIEIRKNKHDDSLLKKMREGLLIQYHQQFSSDAPVDNAVSIRERANIVASLVNLLQNAEFEIKKDVAWAISNDTSGESHAQIQFLVNQGCIKPLYDLICPDPRIVMVCLEGLENILKVGEADKEVGLNGGINLYGQIVDECDGLDKIESLHTHDNKEIYENAVKILEKYWAEEEAIVDECDGLDKIESLQTHDNKEIYENAVKILEKYWAEEEAEEDGAPASINGNAQPFGFGTNQLNIPPGEIKFG